jgi:hypothetical protein
MLARLYHLSHSCSQCDDFWAKFENMRLIGQVEFKRNYLTIFTSRAKIWSRECMVGALEKLQVIQ